jgi:Glycosyl hydrolases family 43
MLPLRFLLGGALLGLGLGVLSPPPVSAAPQTSIVPGALWPDTLGHHIQAHGGGILKEGATYYWFGEDRGGEETAQKPLERKIACYASTDLVNWTPRNQIIRGGPPEADIGRPFVLERPKVFHNARTGKYVLYAHLDDQAYRLARVAVYVSDTVDGDYAYVRSFRPLGKESRDIGQFVDDDGAAYLIFESRPTKGFFIARLSDDYLDVAAETCFIQSPLEGGALVKYDGLYYIIGSWMTGWKPNANQYATAPALSGPWSEFRDIAPPGRQTYGSQSTLMLKVVGSKKTSVIFMGDLWRPARHQDGRYLWMPLEIGAGRLWLPEPREWTIDLATGEPRFLPAP